MQESAGTLLYRHTSSTIEMLLVHPSGSFNRRAPWSIPKGLVDQAEDVEAAARRETLEETGIEAGSLISIGSVDYQKSRKRIYCFAGEAPLGAVPRCASWEVDRTEFVALDEARRLIHPDQVHFIERLLRQLDRRGE
jgi:predicted NUDIX family NTP pyrophosphohydrolase